MSHRIVALLAVVVALMAAGLLVLTATRISQGSERLWLTAVAQVLVIVTCSFLAVANWSMRR